MPLIKVIALLRLTKWFDDVDTLRRVHNNEILHSLRKKGIRHEIITMPWNIFLFDLWQRHAIMIIREWPKSLLSYGYHAGYIKDKFGCNKRPCKCAGFELKDKTVIGMDLHFLSSVWPTIEALVCFQISVVVKLL